MTPASYFPLAAFKRSLFIIFSLLSKTFQLALDNFKTFPYTLSLLSHTPYISLIFPRKRLSKFTHYSITNALSSLSYYPFKHFSYTFSTTANVTILFLNVSTIVNASSLYYTLLTILYVTTIANVSLLIHTFLLSPTFPYLLLTNKRSRASHEPANQPAHQSLDTANVSRARFLLKLSKGDALFPLRFIRNVGEWSGGRTE